MIMALNHSQARESLVSPPPTQTGPSEEATSKPIHNPMYTLGDLIRARAREPVTKDEPVLLYPSSGTNYVGYSPCDLETLSNKTASFYDQTVPCRTSSDEPPQTVALLGASSFDYLIALLALSKLGHTVLLLSTRISDEAHLSLIKATKTSCLLVSNDFTNTAERLKKHIAYLRLTTIASHIQYNACTEFDFDIQRLDGIREAKNIALIIHSSGSTSLPKPTYQSHSAALGNFKSQFSLIGFITLPIFHMQGLGCVFRSIMNRKPIYMYNAALPLTNRHLATTLREHPDIQILYGVPYTMKLLADTEEGIELCKRLEVVISGGSAVPKPIGDKLAAGGVNLVSHFGSSETGQLMNSFRPPSDIKEWDWLRPSERLLPYLSWEPYDESLNLFELVVLEGWPSKSASNRANGAYATGDLWERHPHYPTKNAWRYYSRKDDTIVLVNGEKANPLEFEGLVRESPKVDEAIVFGSQKPHLGIFVIPSDPSMTQEQMVNAVWPAIERGNKIFPAHAQISRDMVKLLPPEDVSRIRKTDKASLIRAAFYKEFAAIIDAIYEEPTNTGSLVLDDEGLKQYLKNEIGDIIPPDRQSILSDSVELFSLGLDSLQASRIRSAILKNIYLGDEKLAQNFVFDFPSIQDMARELLRMRTSGKKAQEAPIQVRMEQIIDKYTIGFQRPEARAESVSTEKTVLVTGATGSLGAHLVAQLAARSEISRVFCLVRADSDSTALDRVQKSLLQRKIDNIDIHKVHALAADLSDLHLGLSDEIYQSLTSHLSAVFHCAWQVNFNMKLESFEKDCIRGTRNIIDLCLRVSDGPPAELIFCSSVGTIANTSQMRAPEDLSEDLSVCQRTGYSQSKLLAEHICQKASISTGMSIKILRIGQIVGDTKSGVWNAQEAIPMVLKSAKTVGALPELDERHCWLPVDTTATGIIEIWRADIGQFHSGRKWAVYNVVNNRSFHWTRDLLPLLRASGLHFEMVSPNQWLTLLHNNPDPVKNPPYRLMEFFDAKYSKGPQQHLNCVTDRARAASDALANAPCLSQDIVNKFLHYLELV